MLNNYGMPGTIDSPTAEAFPEGQFTVSSSVFGGTIRTNLSFQISDTVTTSFRYSRIPSLLVITKDIFGIAVLMFIT